MFDGGGDEMTTAGGLGGVGCAPEGEVDGVGAAAGEHQFTGARSDQCRYGVTRVVEPRFGALAEGVDRGRVARLVGEHAAHRVGHTRRDRCGGVIIKINAHGVAPS